METTDLLDKLLDLAEQQASLVRFGLQEEIIPTWLLVNAQDEIKIVPTPWTNDLEKEVAKLYVQAWIRNFKAIAYSFLTEAWTAHQPPGWKPEDGISEAERPMHRADRQETVIACACDGTTKKWRTWRIIRDHLEQVVTLERLEDERFSDYSGWPAELLPLPAAPAKEGQAE